MKTLKAARISASILSVSMAIGTSFAYADDTPSPNTPTPGQIQASLLIAGFEQTLTEASSISANFQEIDSYPGQYRDLKQAGSVLAERPNKFDIDIKRFRRVDATSPWDPSGNNAKSISDGATYTYAFLHPYSTQIQQSASDLSAVRSAFKGLPVISQFFETSATGKLPGQLGLASAQPDVQWNEATYQVIRYQVESRQQSDPTTATAYIGDDQLIHRLVYSTTCADGTSTKEWTLDNVKLNGAVADSQFAYEPPKDATALDSGNASGALSPGDIAPDFTAYTQDGKAVKLSDYRGKTVILDFWATWCWPCNQSLPHTEEIGKKYSDKNVVVLAVAIRDSQLGFDKWLKRHNYPDIAFVRDPNPEGKDIASTLYGVSTTPAAYVIDSDGKVVQSIAGYSGPTTELASAVTFALQHKATVVDAR